MPSTTHPEEEEIVDVPENDGNASMPEQVKRPNPWKKKKMMMMIIIISHKVLSSIRYIHKIVILWSFLNVRIPSRA
jgi:hypothetical protein